MSVSRSVCPNWQLECATATEVDRLRRFVEWVAGHQLVPGVYADDDHPYDEWITPDKSEMDFGEVQARAKEALGDA